MAPAAMALLSAIPGLIQSGVGLWQGNRAKKLLADRPEYEIPSAIQKLVQMAGADAHKLGVAGEQGIKQDLTASSARGITELEKLGTGSDLLGAATDVISGEQRSLTQLGIEGARAGEGRKANYADALTQLAGYEDKKFDLNEMQPWIMAVNQSSALKEAALQNVVGGVSSGISSSMQSYNMSEYLKFLMGEGANQSTGGNFKANPKSASYSYTQPYGDEAKLNRLQYADNNWWTR